eukprot:m.217760 g.217760  ORF g.217760 m.217760 type:complete len:95 (+) comp33244_c1_seq4:89-373(+)
MRGASLMRYKEASISHEVNTTQISLSLFLPILFLSLPTPPSPPLPLLSLPAPPPPRVGSDNGDSTFTGSWVTSFVYVWGVSECVRGCGCTNVCV